MSKFLAKKEWVIGITVLIILVSIILFLNFRGRTTKNNLRNLEPGITQIKVIEYIGSPKRKTIDKDEIKNWAPDDLISDKYPNLEMYTYTYEDGEARLYFTDGLLIYKQPLKLNLSDEEYFDLMIGK